MQYRSIPDMSDVVQRNLHRLSGPVDLVVGLPGSGILAANLFCLAANTQMTDLDSFVAGRTYAAGVTKFQPQTATGQEKPRRILVLDDCIRSGDTLSAARRRIAEAGIDGEILYAAVFGAEGPHPAADLVFETVSDTCLFQWSFMTDPVLEDACVDIDGVLCLDPTEAENDDGPAYLDFLIRARPLYAPRHPIGALVTSRLEKYRPQTESWLAERGIVYRKLVMLDLPSKAERLRLGVHGRFKADVYRESTARLFIESEHGQAVRIARLSGKPVLCLETHQMVGPDFVAEAPLQRTGGRDVLKRVARNLLGPDGYAALKRRISRSA